MLRKCHFPPRQCLKRNKVFGLKCILIFLLERLIQYFLESITFLLPMPDVVREYSLQIEMSKQA